MARQIDVDGIDIDALDYIEVRNFCKNLRAELSVREMVFVDELLNSGNKHAAAKKAGYQPHYGKRLVKKKSVMHCLTLERERIYRETGIDAGWCRAMLIQNIADARAANDYGTVRSSIAELAKMGGYYATDQLRVMHSNHEGGPLADQTDDDLLKLIGRIHHEARRTDAGTDKKH